MVECKFENDIIIVECKFENVYVLLLLDFGYVLFYFFFMQLIALI